MYAIVDDATYNNVKGDEKSVGVLKFDKDPSKEFLVTTASKLLNL